MFDQLTGRLSSIFERLKNRGALTESDVNDALREVRVALLEADVALPAAKHFIEEVKKVAAGQEIVKSITPGQMVVKIVYDELINLLGNETLPLNLQAKPPVVFLMVGLQGSGKTTTSAKIGKYLKEKLNKRVLLASLDVYRPAAQEQLEILGKQLGLETLPIKSGEKPLSITERALEASKKQGADVLILDTAGRLHIDETLMEELKAVYSLSAPTETLLVADAMTGQDAVTMADAFHKSLELTGCVLTRMDGDARGGAALSIRYVTGCPIKMVGVGEKLDQLEVFDPRRIADRILDRGDIVALVEKASTMVDQEEAAKMAAKMQKGQFDLNDLAKQLQQMMKMGGMGGIMNLMPGMGKIKEKMGEAGIDDKILKSQLGIISSMTPLERKKPDILNGSRKKRIAKGSGVEVSAVNRLLKQYDQMALLMKRMKKMGGGKGMLRGGLAGLLGGGKPPF